MSQILAAKEEEEKEEGTALAREMSAKDILKRGVELYKEGSVIFREQFFSSACEKYKKSADFITVAEKVLIVSLPDR